MDLRGPQPQGIAINFGLGVVHFALLRCNINDKLQKADIGCSLCISGYGDIFVGRYWRLAMPSALITTGGNDAATELFPFSITVGCA